MLTSLLKNLSRDLIEASCRFGDAFREPGRHRTVRCKRCTAPLSHAIWIEKLETRTLFSATTVAVVGEANIFGAGINALPAPDGGGGGVAPVPISLSALGNPGSLFFPNVSGSVTAGGVDPHYNNADGGPYYIGHTNIVSEGGISGIRDSNVTMFLVGVFLGPNGQPVNAPATLDVSEANSTASFAPVIGQQFFVGNGKTSSDALQTFTVPTGASTLYLGFDDSWEFGSASYKGLEPGLPGWYYDNRGSLTVKVESPNHAPVGTSNTVSTMENTGYTFTTSDFGFSDPNDNPQNALSAVEITSLPTNGTLWDHGRVVTAFQFVSVGAINDGWLTYVPQTNAVGSAKAEFTFKVQDNGGTVDGGIDLDPTDKLMTINVLD